MGIFSLIPTLITVIDWCVKNEPTLEKDAKAILTASKDILNEVHALRTTVVAEEAKK